MAAPHSPSSLSRYLDGEFWKIRDNLREGISNCELFQRSSYDLSLDQIRDLTADRLHYAMKLPLMQRHLTDQVLGRKKHFLNRSVDISEMICSADMATGVKMGVVCGLYGGAVTNLGSPEQVKQFYAPVLNLAFTGMFALTERGHGSNARGILTEAHYEPATQEFIIHTPCEDAQKMYIGNAMKGHYAAVFAQLIIKGEPHGPHCFIVPIRDQHGVMWPGVTAFDMRHKEGLHGVDNGILIFDHVRIPRENLLDKFGSVSADGKYSSRIRSKGTRFNAMIAALTPTRLALTVQAMAAMKLGLIIAVRYSHSRRQFGPKDQDEVKIIEHQTQYLRLMPHLATSLALTFTVRYAARLMDDALSQGQDLQSNRPLQALVAGLKAYSTWANVVCLQECRECTGGMGFMMENRIPSLKCDSDVFVTFEGDNMVMLQVVVRELMTQYTKQFEDSIVTGMIRNWSSSASDRIRTSFLGFSVDKVGDLSFLLKALSYRERVLQRSLAARLYAKVEKNKEEFFSAWNSCLHHVTSLALAHIHRVTLEQFALAVQECQVKDDQDLLSKFCLLHGTSLVYQERAWYLEHNYLSPGASRQIRNQLLELCRSVKDDALKVVADFNFPSCCIQAPIAGVVNPRAEWGFYPLSESPVSQSHAQQRAMSKL
ncbi:acyl-coenzyme A oxidase-like protein [Astyanax mexicanus]|uniref:Acyl-coenzyme A oxidase n=1 Tax=Astyanax mexicanus TaxID=7994 RepID=A0A8T2LTG3_ASTMX|nr:acyl-coenzyme A oxidase-like protein [Astyanax mexicanus]KAG9275009.1 acyl-coenzyme A oxidase-like protein [Astyanax mexicanus]